MSESNPFILCRSIYSVDVRAATIVVVATGGTVLDEPKPDSKSDSVSRPQTDGTLISDNSDRIAEPAIAHGTSGA